MDKLIALAIPGESFLLQRGGRNILVDGGYGSRTLVTALKAPELAINQLDIVVCTHADQDHAGGLVDLIDQSAIEVKEFWLPGEWGDSLPDLLQEPQRVVDALIAELDSSEFVSSNAQDQSYDEFEEQAHAALADELRRSRSSESRDVIPASQDEHNQEAGLAWLIKHASNVDLNDESVKAAVSRTFDNGRRKVRHREAKGYISSHWATFWLNAIKTAERIRRIAAQAIRHNVRVRWFDFNEFAHAGQPSGGIPRLLLPLNAVELVVPPAHTFMARYIACLSPVNEQSLVFRSPGRDDWPFDLDVVFTADSPLGTGNNYANSFLRTSGTRRVTVATAPHHGSENNSMAYAHLSNIAEVVLWLRSGGSAKQPGPTFKSLPPHIRACMHCPQRGYARALTEVQLSWVLPFWRLRSHHCCC